MNKDWKTYKIGEVYDIEKGTLQSSKNEEGKYPFITASQNFKSHNSYEYDCEALIFACAASGSLGRTHHFHGKFTSSDLCFVLTVNDSHKEKSLPLFHYFYLNFNKEYIVNQTKTGTSKAAINKRNFNTIEIPLPPLSEQQRIVNKIKSVEDKLEQIQTLNTQQEQDIKNILFSLYTDLVKGVPSKPMKEVAPIKRNKVEIFAEQEYQEIGVRSFGKGTFDKPSFKGADLTWQKPYWMKEGDLLFSNIKAWEGAVALIEKKDDGKVGSHRYITCRPDLDLVVPEYLLFHLLLPSGIDMLSQASPGTADRNRTLQTRKLEAIQVQVPSIDKQKQFVKILKQFQQLNLYRTKQQEELQQLIPGLLDKAFKGELFDTKETESIPIAAEPQNEYGKPESLIPKNKRGFAKQVLGGKIVSLFKNDKHFTNIKFQKIQYLAEHLAEEDLNWNYYRQTAGPYDNKFMHTVFNKLRQNQWFGSSNYKFYPLQKADKIEGFYQGYFGAKTEKLSELFKLLRNASEKFCEAVATIYAVWNNRIILNKEFNQEAIKKEFFEWSHRKEEIFTDDNFEQALMWMQKHDIVPNGFGKLIKEKKK